jgi:undecaprenyl-diphosphatase
MAMMILYLSKIKLILAGIFAINKNGLRLLLKLILGVLPCLVVGLMTKGSVEKFCTTPWIAMALIIGAFMMIFAENFYRKSKKIDNFDSITYKNALFIGACQCIAIIPGISRSMATILGGYFSNLSRAVAIEFSFLIGMITMSLATIYKLLFAHADLQATIPAGYAIKGIIVAFLTSLLVMKASIGILEKYGLYLFAIYRILLAMTIIFLVNFA